MTLAARQAALLRALLVAGDCPAGFDADQLRSARHALLTKRAMAVAYRWMPACRALGTDFIPAFHRYATAHPVSGPSEPLADGYRFLRYLAGTRRLPDVARLRLLAFRAQWTVRAAGAPRPRRAPWLAAMVICRPRYLVLVVSLAGRARTLRVPLGRARLRRRVPPATIGSQGVDQP